MRSSFLIAFALFIASACDFPAHAEEPKCITYKGEQFCKDSASTPPANVAVPQPAAPQAISAPPSPPAQTAASDQLPPSKEVMIGNTRCLQVLQHHSPLIGSDYDSWEVICPPVPGYNPGFGSYGYSGFGFGGVPYPSYGYPYRRYYPGYGSRIILGIRF